SAAPPARARRMTCARDRALGWRFMSGAWVVCTGNQSVTNLRTISPSVVFAAIRGGARVAVDVRGRIAGLPPSGSVDFIRVGTREEKLTRIEASIEVCKPTRAHVPQRHIASAEISFERIIAQVDVGTE